jgi:hypothetical protein
VNKRSLCPLAIKGIFYASMVHNFMAPLSYIISISYRMTHMVQNFPLKSLNLESNINSQLQALVFLGMCYILCTFMGKVTECVRGSYSQRFMGKVGEVVSV